MRTILVSTIFGLCLFSGMRAQSDHDRVVGTWSGPARCLHGNGETFTMTITRDSDGRLSGTMDWALSSSDGRRGPGVPFTTLTIKGSTITATLTADGRTARLEATVDGDSIAGGWSTDGDSDRWTFEGTRQVPPAARGTVTVTPSVAASAPGSIRVRPAGEFTATGVTLRERIAYAYQRHPFDTRDVAGGPEWMDVDRFDVVAPLPGELAVSPDGPCPRRFDIVLEAADITPPLDYVPGPSDLALPPPSGPPMAIAVREQLGLTLEPETGSIPVVIVNHAARPAAP